MSELTPYGDLIARLRKWVSYSNGIPSQPEICKEAADALSDCERRIAEAVAQERERCAKKAYLYLLHYEDDPAASEGRRASLRGELK